MATKHLLCLVWGVGLAVMAVPGVASADCKTVLAALGDRVADATCSDSTDLTTNHAATTPQNNSIANLAPGAYTPLTDRGLISPDPPNRTAIDHAVPGIQVSGRFTSDKAGQARFVLRFPADWNGRLVVAGASGTRSEHNSDFTWSDYVLQKGYAYASQNKGVWNASIVSTASPTQPATDPASCRLNPASPVWVHFFDDEPGKPFTQWTQYMLETARLAQRAAEAQYRRRARRTYAVGTSNGGYQVRRAIEEAPDLFDGGVDWEGTFIDPHGPNLLLDLPPAVTNYPAYLAAGLDAKGPAAKAIEAAGYPPDIVHDKTSFWGLHWTQFWEVTQCQWQKRFDPTFPTYSGGLNEIGGTGGYDYAGRVAKDASIAKSLATVATTGRIKRPLITVAGTMDALLPIQHGARAYEALVRHAPCERGRCDHDRGDRGNKAVQYRLYEVQNGNHIETFKNTFSQLEFIQPHAQRAFDLLVDHVEHDAPLPPSQCIPRGGAIAASPSQPGHCAQLLVP